MHKKNHRPARDPKPCAFLCAHAGCKREVPDGALWCDSHLREANRVAAKNRLLGWVKTGRAER